MRSGNVLHAERVTKRWSMNERVHPLSIRTLIGSRDSDSAEAERTSWLAEGEKEEKA